MTRRPLTARQQEVADFIANYTRDNGYPPTTVEIAEKLSVNAGAAREHVLALQRKGYLTYEPYAARTMVLIGEDELIATVRVHKRRDGSFYADADHCDGRRRRELEAWATVDGLMFSVARWMAGDAA